jgi:hypothetical protein
VPKSTVVAHYALVFYGCGACSGFPMKDLDAYTAWQERTMNRSMVRKSVEAKQNLST